MAGIAELAGETISSQRMPSAGATHQQEIAFPVNAVVRAGGWDRRAGKHWPLWLHTGICLPAQMNCFRGCGFNGHRGA